MNKKVLFIITSASIIGRNNRKTGYFLPEVAHPYAEFIQEGYTVDFASVAGGEPPVDGFDLEDPLNKQFVESEGWIKIKQSAKLENVLLEGYDAVFIPGGLGPMVDMPENTILQKIIAQMYELGKVIGAVCHGPVALLNVKLSNGDYLIKGKQITSFSNAEEEGYAKDDVPFLLEDALKDRGAIYSSEDVWQPHSIADGKLITGQNPASASPVAQKMIAAIEA